MIDKYVTETALRKLPKMFQFISFATASDQNGVLYDCICVKYHLDGVC